MEVQSPEFLKKRKYHLKKKTTKFILRIVLVVLIWAIFITSLFLNNAKLVNIKIEGNVYFTDSEILKMADISKKNYKWDVFAPKVAKKINKNAYLSHAKMQKGIKKVTLSVQETFPIGEVKDGILFNDGSLKQLSDLSLSYQKRIGLIPYLDLEVNRELLDNFKTADVEYANFVKENQIVISLPKYNDLIVSVNDTYQVSFKTSLEDKLVDVEVIISSDNITKKLNYDFLKMLKEQLVANPQLISNGSVLVIYLYNDIFYYQGNNND